MFPLMPTLILHGRVLPILQPAQTGFFLSLIISLNSYLAIKLQKFTKNELILLNTVNKYKEIFRFLYRFVSDRR